VDRKPPRLATDERETVLSLLQFQRDSLVRKLDGLDDADARSSPVASGTSLAWIVAHLAVAEDTWAVQRFAGQPPSVDVADPPTTGDAVARYRAAWARTDAIARASGLDERCRGDVADPPVTLRWVLLHLLEETARHVGHADIIRELLDGQVGR